MKLVLQLLGAPGVKLPVPNDGAAKKPSTEMLAGSKEAKTEVGVTAENIPVSLLLRFDYYSLQSPYQSAVPLCLTDLFFAVFKEGGSNEVLIVGKGEPGSRSLPSSQEPREKCTEADERTAAEDMGNDSKPEDKPLVEEDGGGVAVKEPPRKRIQQSEVQKLRPVAESPKRTRAEKAAAAKVEKPPQAAEEAKLKGKRNKDRAQGSKGIKDKEKDVPAPKATKEKERKADDSAKKGKKTTAKEV
jgi:hypothetical protein